MRLAITILVGGFLLAIPARAQELHQLERTSPGWLALETGGAIVFFITYSLATGDVPRTCSWCEPNAFDRGIRDFVVMDNRRAPATVSHVLSMGVVPVGALSALAVPAISAGKGEYALADSWIVVNSFLLATGLADGTKKLFARRRPAFAVGDASQTEVSRLSDPGIEENLSFFSGDTAWAASVTASAASLAYLRGYSTAPWILGVGSALTVTTGVLRMSADMHWATDVLGGVVAGGLAGVALPLMLHRRSNAEVTAMPMIMPSIDNQAWVIGMSGVF